MLSFMHTHQPFIVDTLRVDMAPNRQVLGERAAQAVAEKIRALQQVQDFVNIIFASAPSQNEFLDELVQQPDIAWHRIRAFHMDEYVGLADDAPQNFGFFLKQRLFDNVPVAEVFYLNGNAAPEQECERYAALLETYRTDIVCMGIGENCHIAFNDPHVANFHDPVLVKKVQLDFTSRMQQVHDACFETLEQVPTDALTLTIPALVRAQSVFCMVPARHKAEAIRHTLLDEISETYPATVLRTHPDATLFIDQDSAALLRP